jgi:hypothetical protein
MVKASSSKLLALMRHSNWDPNAQNGLSGRAACEAAPSVTGQSDEVHEADDMMLASQHLSEAEADWEVGLLTGQRPEFVAHRLAATDKVLVLTAIDTRSDSQEQQSWDVSHDVIRLTDVDALQDISSGARQDGAWEPQSGVLMIHTRSHGNNAGRRYCLRLDGNSVDFAGFLDQLRSLIAKAKLAALDHSWPAKFRRSRIRVKEIFRSSAVQVAVSMFIFANFLANAFESQYKASLVRDDGTPTPVGHALINLDLFFTWVFTLELLMNIYAHWREEFVSDNWNIFDLFVVSTGHIAMLMPSGERIPVTILRLLRAFRVLRIFGRMKSIRLIINALSASIIPVLNAFFVMGIVLVLYAIIGTTVFEGVDEQFDTLDR